MKFDLILAVDDGNGHVTNISLGQVTRAEVSDMATLGLSLAGSKQLLAQLQHEVVVRQFEATTQQRRHCEQCGTRRAIKDFHGARFRSLFGDVRPAGAAVAQMSMCRGRTSFSFGQAGVAPTLLGGAGT